MFQNDTGRHEQGLKLFHDGLQLDAAGKTEEAIDRYRSAVSCCPDLAQAHYSLGFDLALVGQCDEAVRAWRRAVWLNRDYRRELSKALSVDDELEEIETTPSRV